MDDPGQRHILIQGRVDGPATDLDRVFHDTPLARQLPDGLLDWRFRDGTVGGHLLLDLPLGGKGRDPMVIVDGRGERVSLRNEPLNLSLTDVSAPVYFHLKQGMNMRTLEGRALGARFQGSWLTGARTARCSLPARWR
ncbi:hypothetical protein HML84_08710 [Alcanivorax sp. IO_7]|nr:hypothetical protein HML84_08710 [Alcanivorax sp. IO_7]